MADGTGFLRQHAPKIVGGAIGAAGGLGTDHVLRRQERMISPPASTPEEAARRRRRELIHRVAYTVGGGALGAGAGYAGQRAVRGVREAVQGGIARGGEIAGEHLRKNVAEGVADAPGKLAERLKAKAHSVKERIRGAFSRKPKAETPSGRGSVDYENLATRHMVDKYSSVDDSEVVQAMAAGCYMRMKTAFAVDMARQVAQFAKNNRYGLATAAGSAAALGLLANRQSKRGEDGLSPEQRTVRNMQEERALARRQSAREGRDSSYAERMVDASLAASREVAEANARYRAAATTVGAATGALVGWKAFNVLKGAITP